MALIALASRTGCSKPDANKVGEPLFHNLLIHNSLQNGYPLLWGLPGPAGQSFMTEPIPEERYILKGQTKTDISVSGRRGAAVPVRYTAAPRVVSPAAATENAT